MARRPISPEAPAKPALLPTAWRARGQALWRAVIAPPTADSWALSGSATVNAQLWLSHSPLRPTAGWAVLAALLATGWPLVSPAATWRDLALIWLLADPLWGSLWRLAAGRLEMLPLREQAGARPVWLPYLQAGSPAARLLGRDERGVLHLLVRVVAPSAGLAAAIAWVLGPVALWLTALVMAVSVVGWIVRHTVGYIPALLHSLVTVTLPWLLGLLLLGVAPEDLRWEQQVTLVILWTLHHWGEGRALRAKRDYLGLGLLAAADIGLLLLLIAGRAPLALALLAVIWLPMWLAVYQGRPLHRLTVWWLAAMLISAAAIGQAG